MTAVTSPPRDGEVASEILRAARAGDVVAFTALVRHYHPRLRALAFRLLGNRAATDDALQEAYLKAFRGLSGFREAAALSTWLYQLTYRACIDYRRRETRHWARRHTPPRDPDHQSEQVGSSVEADLAATASERVDVARALAALPLDQRAAVLLIDVEGLDYESAAAILGVAPGTVSSRLSRARRILRAALAEGDDQ